MDPDTSSGNAKVPLNYDELQLQAQGHAQDMPRRFSLWSMFAIAFTITCSWVGFSTSLGISLLYGGTASVVYGQIVGALSCAIITLGLAELASAYPSSGGIIFPSATD
jgi:choline transport protein